MPQDIIKAVESIDFGPADELKEILENELEGEFFGSCSISCQFLIRQEIKETDSLSFIVRVSNKTPQKPKPSSTQHIQKFNLSFEPTHSE